MGEKILIFGGTGFIGANLAKIAVDNGYSVTIVCLREPVSRIEGINYILIDISDKTQVIEKLSGIKCDYVINLSGYIDHSSFKNGGRDVIDVHFKGLLNILEAVNWTTLKRFVQIGSSDEYGDQQSPQREDLRESPISSYSLAKTAGTHLLQMLSRTEKLPAVVIRLFLVYGPGQDDGRFIPQIIKGCLSGNEFPTSLGQQTRDFTFVDDISNGILKILKNNNVNGEVINLASGIPAKIRDVVEAIRDKIQKGKPEFGKVPYRAGENMSLYADVSKANDLLGWKAETDLNSGLDKTINYFKK